MKAADLLPNACSTGLADALNLTDLTALLNEAAGLGIKVDDIEVQLLRLDYGPPFGGWSERLTRAVSQFRSELEWALRLHARLLDAEANHVEALKLAALRPRRLAISSQSVGCIVSLDYMVKHAASYDFIMARTPVWFASCRSYLAERNCYMAAVMVDAGSYFHLQETRLARLLAMGELVAD